MYTKEQLPLYLDSDAFTVKSVLSSPSQFNQIRLNTKAGFTLVELMIVVVIVAIISSIAYPSYRESVRKTQRVAAASILLENAQFMERFFTENNNYNIVPANLPFQRAPKEASAVQTYAISVTPGATTYTLQAVPAGSMTGDDCGTLTLNNLSQRNAAGGSPAGGKTVAQCWGQ